MVVVVVVVVGGFVTGLGHSGKGAVGENRDERRYHPICEGCYTNLLVAVLHQRCLCMRMRMRMGGALGVNN